MSSDINDLANRSERLFNAVAEVLLTSVEAGVERLEQAGMLARLKGRMEVFGATLDAIDAQRQPLLDKIERGGTKAILALWHKQVGLLNDQEASVLAKAGVGAELAVEAQRVLEAPKAIPVAPEEPQEGSKLYVRDGRRFAPVANGTPVEN